MNNHDGLMARQSQILILVRLDAVDIHPDFISVARSVVEDLVLVEGDRGRATDVWRARPDLEEIAQRVGVGSRRLDVNDIRAAVPGICVNVNGLDASPRVSMTDIDWRGDVLTVDNNHQLNVFMAHYRFRSYRRKGKTTAVVPYLDEIISDADESSNPDDKDDRNCAYPRSSASPLPHHSAVHRPSRR